MTTATTPSTMSEEWDRRLTSRAERYAAGKALRSKAPHSSHAAHRSRGIGTRAVPGGKSLSQL
ncbi:MAG TPA: hypothetical protein VIY29_17785 [Ktedonobacteraceae bacterium]